MNFNIRKASKDDLQEVLNLVKELALYENAPEEVTISLEDLEKDGFGDSEPLSVIGERGDSDLIDDYIGKQNSVAGDLSRGHSSDRDPTTDKVVPKRRRLPILND